MSLFFIPGPPIPKGRARIARGHAFTPATTRAYEAKVRQCFVAQRRGQAPLQGPVRADIIFYLPDKRRKDLDNLAKAVTDALNGLAYEDDSQIHRLVLAKVFGAEKVGALVLIEPFTEVSHG